MRLPSRLFFVATTLLCTSSGFGQALIEPSVFTRPVIRAANAPSGEEPQQSLFSSGDVALPVDDKSQFGASSKLYTLSVYGFPKCTQSGGGGPETCVSQYWFTLHVEANVVSAVSGQASAIREYIFSQKGSPLALSIPGHTWTTKKGDVKQSWFAFSFGGDARLIPVTGATNNLSGGGTLSLWGTGQASIEFDATEPGSDPSGAGTTYPGMLYFSITPTIAGTAGGPLKAAIFQSSPTASWVWGGEYRVGFQFKGQKPISLGITGTFSAKGITSSSNGVAISLSKLFGGTR
jgi:hypothetical protein